MMNLADAYKKYVKENINSKQVISNLNTAFIRYTLPSLGFIIPERSSKRLHPNDIKLAIEFSSQFILDKNISGRLLAGQRETIDSLKMSLPNKRQQKKNLKKFLNFALDYKQDIQEPKKKKNREFIHYKLVKNLEDYDNLRPRRNIKDKIIFHRDNKKIRNYILVDSVKFRIIEKELESFEKFSRFNNKSKHTIREELLVIRRLLGWQLLCNKSPENVGLQFLIPKFDLYPDIDAVKDFNEYFILKGRMEKEARESSKKTIRFLNGFFKEYKVTGKSSKEHYIRGLIAIAKFIYKDVTDEEEYENYNDIPVIRRLRICRNNIPKETKNINAYLPSWGLVMECLKELKRRADLTHYIGNPMNKRQKGISLQKFLILAMFTLVPPSRSRVIRELEIGKTFKHGLFKDNIFVPISELEEVNKAKYYIHLQPEEYKTGNKYGEWLAEFPNVEFEDGTTIYQYIDRWLYEGFRDELLADKNLNFLFFRERSSTPFDIKTMGKKVSNIFLSTLKLNVSPHKLRTIYRTHLADIGASQQVLESSAFWMRHSPEIAKEVYTKQSLDNKLKPGAEMISQINQELLMANQHP